MAKQKLSKKYIIPTVAMTTSITGALTIGSIYAIYANNQYRKMYANIDKMISDSGQDPLAYRQANNMPIDNSFYNPQTNNQGGQGNNQQNSFLPEPPATTNQNPTQIDNIVIPGYESSTTINTVIDGIFNNKSNLNSIETNINNLFTNSNRLYTKSNNTQKFRGVITGNKFEDILKSISNPTIPQDIETQIHDKKSNTLIDEDLSDQSLLNSKIISINNQNYEISTLENKFFNFERNMWEHITDSDTQTLFEYQNGGKTIYFEMKIYNSHIIINATDTILNQDKAIQLNSLTTSAKQFLTNFRLNTPNIIKINYDYTQDISIVFGSDYKLLKGVPFYKIWNNKNIKHTLQNKDDIKNDILYKKWIELNKEDIFLALSSSSLTNPFTTIFAEDVTYNPGGFILSNNFKDIVAKGLNNKLTTMVFGERDTTTNLIEKNIEYTTSSKNIISSIEIDGHKESILSPIIFNQERLKIDNMLDTLSIESNVQSIDKKTTYNYISSNIDEFLTSRFILNSSKYDETKAYFTTNNTHTNDNFKQILNNIFTTDKSKNNYYNILWKSTKMEQEAYGSELAKLLYTRLLSQSLKLITDRTKQEFQYLNFDNLSSIPTARSKADDVKGVNISPLGLNIKAGANLQVMRSLTSYQGSNKPDFKIYTDTGVEIKSSNMVNTYYTTNSLADVNYNNVTLDLTMYGIKLADTPVNDVNAFGLIDISKLIAHNNINWDNQLSEHIDQPWGKATLTEKGIQTGNGLTNNLHNTTLSNGLLDFYNGEGPDRENNIHTGNTYKITEDTYTQTYTDGLELGQTFALSQDNTTSAVEEHNGVDQKYFLDKDQHFLSYQKLGDTISPIPNYRFVRAYGRNLYIPSTVLEKSNEINIKFTTWSRYEDNDNTTGMIGLANIFGASIEDGKNAQYTIDKRDSYRPVKRVYWKIHLIKNSNNQWIVKFDSTHNSDKLHYLNIDKDFDNGVDINNNHNNTYGEYMNGDKYLSDNIVFNSRTAYGNQQQVLIFLKQIENLNNINAYTDFLNDLKNGNSKSNKSSSSDSKGIVMAMVPRWNNNGGFGSNGGNQGMYAALSDLEVEIYPTKLFSEKVYHNQIQLDNLQNSQNNANLQNIQFGDRVVTTVGKEIEQGLMQPLYNWTQTKDKQLIYYIENNKIKLEYKNYWELLDYKIDDKSIQDALISGNTDRPMKLTLFSRVKNMSVLDILSKISTLTDNDSKTFSINHTYKFIGQSSTTTPSNESYDFHLQLKVDNNNLTLTSLYDGESTSNPIKVQNTPSIIQTRDNNQSIDYTIDIQNTSFVRDKAKTLPSKTVYFNSDVQQDESLAQSLSIIADTTADKDAKILDMQSFIIDADTSYAAQIVNRGLPASIVINGKNFEDLYKEIDKFTIDSDITKDVTILTRNLIYNLIPNLLKFDISSGVINTSDNTKLLNIINDKNGAYDKFIESLITSHYITTQDKSSIWNILNPIGKKTSLEYLQNMQKSIEDIFLHNQTNPIYKNGQQDSIQLNQIYTKLMNIFIRSLLKPGNEGFRNNLTTNSIPSPHNDWYNKTITRLNELTQNNNINTTRDLGAYIATEKGVYNIATYNLLLDKSISDIYKINIKPIIVIGVNDADYTMLEQAFKPLTEIRKEEADEIANEGKPQNTNTQAPTNQPNNGHIQISQLLGTNFDIFYTSDLYHEYRERVASGEITGTQVVNLEEAPDAKTYYEYTEKITNIMRNIGITRDRYVTMSHKMVSAYTKNIGFENGKPVDSNINPNWKIAVKSFEDFKPYIRLIKDKIIAEMRRYGVNYEAGDIQIDINEDSYNFESAIKPEGAKTFSMRVSIIHEERGKDYFTGSTLITFVNTIPSNDKDRDDALRNFKNQFSIVIPKATPAGIGAPTQLGNLSMSAISSYTLDNENFGLVLYQTNNTLTIDTDKPIHISNGDNNDIDYHNLVEYTKHTILAMLKQLRKSDNQFEDYDKSYEFVNNLTIEDILTRASQSTNRQVTFRIKDFINNWYFIGESQDITITLGSHIMGIRTYDLDTTSYKLNIIPEIENGNVTVNRPTEWYDEQIRQIINKYTQRNTKTFGNDIDKPNLGLFVYKIETNTYEPLTAQILKQMIENKVHNYGNFDLTNIAIWDISTNNVKFTQPSNNNAQTIDNTNNSKGINAFKTSIILNVTKYDPNMVLTSNGDSQIVNAHTAPHSTLEQWLAIEDGIKQNKDIKDDGKDATIKDALKDFILKSDLASDIDRAGIIDKVFAGMDGTTIQAFMESYMIQRSKLDHTIPSTDDAISKLFNIEILSNVEAQTKLGFITPANITFEQLNSDNLTVYWIHYMRNQTLDTDEADMISTYQKGGFYPIIIPKFNQFNLLDSLDTGMKFTPSYSMYTQLQNEISRAESNQNLLSNDDVNKIWIDSLTHYFNSKNQIGLYTQTLNTQDSFTQPFESFEIIDSSNTIKHLNTEDVRVVGVKTVNIDGKLMNELTLSIGIKMKIDVDSNDYGSIHQDWVQNIYVTKLLPIQTVELVKSATMGLTPTNLVAKDLDKALDSETLYNLNNHGKLTYVAPSTPTQDELHDITFELDVNGKKYRIETNSKNNINGEYAYLTGIDVKDFVFTRDNTGKLNIQIAYEPKYTAKANAQDEIRNKIFPMWWSQHLIELLNEKPSLHKLSDGRKDLNWIDYTEFIKTNDTTVIANYNTWFDNYYNKEILLRLSNQKRLITTVKGSSKSWYDISIENPIYTKTLDKLSENFPLLKTMNEDSLQSLYNTIRVEIRKLENNENKDLVESMLTVLDGRKDINNKLVNLWANYNILRNSLGDDVLSTEMVAGYDAQGRAIDQYGHMLIEGVNTPTKYYMNDIDGKPIQSNGDGTYDYVDGSGKVDTTKLPEKSKEVTLSTTLNILREVDTQELLEIFENYGVTITRELLTFTTTWSINSNNYNYDETLETPTFAIHPILTKSITNNPVVKGEQSQGGQLNDDKPTMNALFITGMVLAGISGAGLSGLLIKRVINKKKLK